MCGRFILQMLCLLSRCRCCVCTAGEAVWVRCLAGNTPDWARASACVLAVAQVQPAGAAASTHRILHAMLISA